MVVDVLQHVAHAEATILAGDLRVQHDLQQQVAQLLGQRRRIALLDGLQHLPGLLDEEAAQRLVRLLAVPGAAFRRPQMGDDLLRRFKAAVLAQRGQVERRQRANLRAAVEGVERQSLNLYLGRTGGMHQLQREVVWILVHQRQLDVGGNCRAVKLGQQGREGGIERRMMHGGNLQAVQQLQAVQRVHAQLRQQRLHKADAVDDVQRDAFRARRRQQPGRRGLAHQRVARHRVDHVALTRGKQQLRDDGFVNFLEAIVRFVERVEAGVAQRLRQSGDAAVLCRTQKQLLRRVQRTPGPARHIFRRARPQPHNRDAHPRLSRRCCPRTPVLC